MFSTFQIQLESFWKEPSFVKASKTVINWTWSGEVVQRERDDSCGLLCGVCVYSTEEGVQSVGLCGFLEHVVAWNITKCTRQTELW